MAAKETPKCNFDQCVNGDCWKEGDKNSPDYLGTFYECLNPNGKMDNENCIHFQQKCHLCEGSGWMPDADGELISVIVIRGTGNACNVEFLTYPNIDDRPELYKDSGVLNVTTACLQTCQELAAQKEEDNG